MWPGPFCGAGEGARPEPMQHAQAADPRLEPRLWQGKLAARLQWRFAVCVVWCRLLLQDMFFKRVRELSGIRNSSKHLPKQQEHARAIYLNNCQPQKTIAKQLSNNCQTIAQTIAQTIVRGNLYLSLAFLYLGLLGPLLLVLVPEQT